MIKKFAQLLSKAVFIPKSETEEVEGSPIIGEDTTNYEEWIEEEVREREAYTGVPAPDYLPEDPWFPAPVLSEKQISLKEAHEQAVADQQILDESESKESADIHQKFYEMATANWNTVAETQYQGGSENFQEGPGGWNSGNGMGQFKS